MPSVSLTWGSRRWPMPPAGSHGASAGGSSTSKRSTGQQVLGDVGPLGVGERAHGVHERAPGPEQVDGRVDERPLHRRQALRGGGIDPPPRVGAATQRAEPGAGRVDEHAVERAGPERRSRGIGGEDGQVGRVRADQADAGLADVGGDHRGAGRGQQHRLAARRRAQVGDPLPRLRADRPPPPTGWPGPARSRRLAP